MISQIWRGNHGNPLGLATVLSVCQNFYFDHGNVDGQPSTNNWCNRDGITLSEVYGFQATAYPANNYPGAIGVEAPMWGEAVIGDEEADNRMWPRLAALAEVGWTPQSQRSFSDFTSRLGPHGTRLSYMGIHYYPTPGISWGSGTLSAQPISRYHDFIPDTSSIVFQGSSAIQKTGLNPRAALAFFPNPVQGELQLKPGWDQVRIYNVKGKLVAKKDRYSSPDLGPLPNGLYFLKTRGQWYKFVLLK
jgi:hypothetical protein